MNERSDTMASAPNYVSLRREGAQQRAARYLNGAIDLRNCIEFNSQDYAFAFQTHGEIRYLLDNNVVRFYLNPLKEYQKIAPFSRSNAETFQALAVVTAEFLFSRMLCGQWGAPPMISQWHAIELDHHAQKLSTYARGMLRAGRLEDEDKDVETWVDALIAELTDDAGNLSRLRRSIDQMLSPLGGFGDVLVSQALEARQFARMMRENLLMPLHMDYLATPELLETPQREVAEIARWKNVHLAQGGAKSRPSKRNDEADARTLIQLVRLNEEAARQSTSKPIRYLLVTTDSKYYNAAIDWLSNEGKGRIDFFPMRRIGQYVPFLNIHEMPNQIQDNSLFQQIRTTLDAFLSAVGSTSHRFPRPLPGILSGGRPDEESPFASLRILADQMSERSESDPRYLETLKQLAGLWSRLSRESVFLNAQLLARRINSFAALASILGNSSNIRGAILEIMGETIAEVERASVKFSVHHHLAAEIKALRLRDGKISLRRGMAVLSSHFEEFIEGDALAPYLERLVKEPFEIPLSQLLKRVEACDDHRAFFFSAYVAFWATNWENALFFAERALHKFRRGAQVEQRPNEEADLRYFRAVAQRYVAMDMEAKPSSRADVLRKTIEPLRQLCDFAIKHNDRFSECRAILEQGIVHVTVAYVMSLQSDAESTMRAGTHISAALECFESAKRLLEDAAEIAPPDAILYLKAELLIGITGSILHQVFISPQGKKGASSQCRVLSNSTREMFTETQEVLPEIYSIAPDLLDLALEENLSQQSKCRRSIVERMQTLSGSAIYRTRLDQEIIKMLGQKIAVGRGIAGQS